MWAMVYGMDVFISLPLLQSLFSSKNTHSIIYPKGPCCQPWCHWSRWFISFFFRILSVYI